MLNNYFFFGEREGRGVVLSWCANWILLETREIEKTECCLIGVNCNFQAMKLNTAGSACSISCFVQQSCCIWTTAFCWLWDICCGTYVFVPLLSELSHTFQYPCLEAPSCTSAKDKAQYISEYVGYCSNLCICSSTVHP